MWIFGGSIEFTYRQETGMWKYRDGAKCHIKSGGKYVDFLRKQKIHTQTRDRCVKISRWSKMSHTFCLTGLSDR